MQKETKAYPPFQTLLKKAEENMRAAFNDDFATPKAFAVLFSVLNAFQKLMEDKEISTLRKAFCARQYLLFFKKYGESLSLFQEEPASFLKNLEDKLLEQKQLTREEVEKLVTKRAFARKAKDFQTADQIREKLDQMGIKLRDSSKGSEWEMKKNPFP